MRGHSLATELHSIVGSLRPAERDHAAVRQAWRIALACSLGEWVVALRECPRMHNLGAAVLAPQMPLYRERALRVLCKAFAPSLPLGYLARSLGWGGGQAADCRVADCEAWLRSLGTVPAPSSARPGLELDTRAALRTLDRREALRQAAEQAERPDEAGQVGPAVPWHY